MNDEIPINQRLFFRAIWPELMLPFRVLDLWESRWTSRPEWRPQ